MGALLMSESCFGVPMGPISINYDFLEPLDPAMLVHPDEPSMVDYPNEPSMEYPVGPVGHTGPDMNEKIMGSRVRRSMVDYPMDPLMEYPMDLSMEYPVLYPSMEYPMGPGEHTGPDMEDNMMGARSRRSPREPCNQQTIPEILKCFERQG